MLNTMLEKYDYDLRWKDVVVLRFNITRHWLQVLNQSYLPMCISGRNDYEMVNKFCSDRVLMLSREHTKEILTSCGIDDQSAITMCIVSKALSFRDNYWICKSRETRQWKDVNLYKNKFSESIARVSLTGKYEYINLNDDIFTGELTNKGTRAKCYVRNNKNLYLYKNENITEIKSEIISHFVADALGLKSSTYFYDKLYDKDCSVCQILTNELHEMIPCRDIISYYGNNAYNYIMGVDAYNFTLLQLFDYITLNIDRNRDNFALLRYNRQVICLYPAFDHDSCFKGKGVNGLYFVTGRTFCQTLNLLKELPVYKTIDTDLIKSNFNSIDFKNKFLSYKSLEEYNDMLKRVKNL